MLRTLISEHRTKSEPTKPEPISKKNLKFLVQNIYIFFFSQVLLLIDYYSKIINNER